MATIELPTIKYASIDLNRIDVEVREVSSGRGRPRIVKTILDEKNNIRINPTKRFWGSFFEEFGLGTPSNKFFDYFEYTEFFERIQRDMDIPMIAVCLEHVPGTLNTFNAYGCTKSAKHVPYDDVVNMIQSSDPNTKQLYFKNGIVHSVHQSKDPIANFAIGADDYQGYYEISTPVDGHGKPEVFIGTERLFCTNGMTIRNKAFRSEFKIGSKGMSTLAQIIDGYRNEDGYIQLKKRFENADLSFASMREVHRVSQLLQDLTKHHRADLNPMNRAMYDFGDMLGDFTSELGIASLNQVSDKIASGIPMRPSVLSLVQLLSEVSTHHLPRYAQGTVDKFLGSLISNNFDLELSKSHMGEYSDFLLKNKT